MVWVDTLTVKNFTVFERQTIKFSPGLNVLVGENGAGKTHVLKLVYAILATHARMGVQATPAATVGGAGGGVTLVKGQLQSRLAEKLTNVFRAESLGRLARRQPGAQRCEVALGMSGGGGNTAFHFSNRSRTEVVVTEGPSMQLPATPAYIQTRELLTIYPGFASLYDSNVLEFDETWRDTCLLLGYPARRGPRTIQVAELLAPLEEAMGGAVEYDQGGRFYLRTRLGRVEMPLVAEGLRKLGMIAQLIATGALLGNGFLFWDEPEANLNPRLIRKVARTVLGISKGGLQVFIATHSVFLLRELAILLETDEFKGLGPQFIGLNGDGNSVEVQQLDTVEGIGSLVALDEEIDQADRYVMLDASS